VRRSKIVLERNPNHRGYELDVRYANPDDPWDKAAIEALRGKRLPLLDRVEIYPIEEEQPRYLAFVNREHDLLDETPFEFIEQIMPNGKLAPALAKAGVRVFVEQAPETTYDLFNIDDATLGGYTPDKVALRRAMVLAHDRDQELGIVRKGQAVAAQTPVPPGVVGFDPAFLSHQQDHDPARAKALLDMFGYVDKDGDGWRDLPGGKPLRISYKYNTGSQEQRQLALLWVKSMAEIGIRVDATAVQFADLLQDKRVGKFQMASSAWTADYPDAQNFLQLLYGPNIGQSNEARFKLPEYDKTYEKSQRFPDGAERSQLYREMNRLILAYAPWRLGVHRVFKPPAVPLGEGLQEAPDPLYQLQIPGCRRGGAAGRPRSLTMTAYVVRRLWQMIPTLAGVILLIFFLFNWVGGDPAQVLAGKISNPEQIANIRKQLGVDEPYWYQLWVFVKQVFTFDFGRSWSTNEEVSRILLTRVGPTLTIMVPVLIIETTLAVTFAIMVAYVRGTLTDRMIMIVCTTAMSISFLVYIIVFQWLFGFILGWFPVQGWSESFWKNLSTYAPLPILLAVAVGLAPQLRLYRSFFLEEINQDYVRTARAKGLPEKKVMMKHVLRNALIPILTNIGIYLPSVFVGSFLLEVFFSIPGLGREIITAVNRSDFPVIKAVTVYLAMLTMIINLLVDVMYKFVDPRVSFK
jgi:peptide/nickel transport system permease protein